MITKLIDNWGGRLTRDSIGDMNSGLAKYPTTFGNDPFGNVGNLTWQETATQIDPNASVITDLIVAQKERVESGISYVYAVGHTARVYKIQVNDPASHNPNFDNPVLLATLSLNSPTFTRGGSIDFYGTTEHIYIGHNKGVTQLNFDGTGESFIGLLASWVQNVPRPIQQFVGKMYVGNGNNLAEIDSTLTVTTYTKLTPAFPNNTQVRDVDVSPAGTYLEAVVTRLALPDITSSAQDTTLLSNSESYLFKWNGTDAGYTSFNTFPSFSLNANEMFTRYQYTFGYDLAGAAVFNPTNKILSPILSQAPLPNAIGSNGNLVAWATVEFYNGFMRMVNFIFGSLDEDVKTGWWRQFAQVATSPETDVIRVPSQLLVSNLAFGPTSNGYPGGVFGNGKAYFSTVETSAAPTLKYKFYKWFPVSTGRGISIKGVYETQNETSIKLFRNILKKKLKVYEVRIFSETWATGNSFQIDLIGNNGNPIINGTKVFTVGTNVTAGTTTAKYNPAIMTDHSIGFRISNLGDTNFVIDKVEIDIDEVNA